MFAPRNASKTQMSAKLLGLRKAAADAKTHASQVGALFFQGRATQTEKDAAFAASDAAFKAADDQLKAEMHA